MNSPTLARWIVTTLALVGLWWVPDGLAIERQVEEAVLQNNWPAVFARLQADATQASDPVARLLLGHASLATNRNNTSLILLLSVQEPGDLQQWAAWTSQLLQGHPQNPVALYLAADAAARAGRFAEARAGFTRAIELQPDFALAYNARGVVRVLTNEADQALMDFMSAIRFAPELADAHANLGTYWVVREAPQGAEAAFNQALTTNPEFALAYNGRGCAYFGQGKYDAALTDMDRAFDLAEVLLPALANQGFLLAAIASHPSFTRDASQPGTTLLAQSELEQVDYTSFTNADQMRQFHDSVRALGQKDPVAAVRVEAVQLAKLRLRMTELSNTITARGQARAAADDLVRPLQTLDQALGLLKLGNQVAPVVSQRPRDWQSFVMSTGRQGARTGADTLPADTPGQMTAEVLSRTLDFPYKSLLRVALYFSAETAKTYGYIANTQQAVALTELPLRAKQSQLLQQEQGRYLAQAITQGADLKTMDVLDLGKKSTPSPASGPLPTYAISAQAPLTQFRALPNTMAQESRAAREGRLVVIGGETDAYRLGLMVRGLQDRGAQVLPAPPNIRPEHFGAMVGADQIVKITAPKVGGVSQDMSHAHVDVGQWPVMTTFGLLYSRNLQKESGR